MNYLKHLIAGLALGLIVLCSQVEAGTVYVDTAGNGASATNSGGTDTSTPTATGTAASNVGTTVTLDVSTNLGTVITTPGLTQTSINIAGATNANRTLFWITGVTSGCTGTAVACVITVDTAPTGLTSNAWAVGGRYLFPSGSTDDVIDGALGLSGGSDAVTFNTSPASRTGSFIIARNAGTTTTGNITIQGKAGTLPVLTISSGAASVLNVASANWTISNLSIANSGTGPAIAPLNNTIVMNVKVVGGAGMGTFALPAKIINCEVSGSSTDAIIYSAGSGIIYGNYLHGNTGNGLTLSSAGPSIVVSENVITGNSKGISVSGATTAQSHQLFIDHNSVYGNASDGLNVANANTVVTLTNSIFQDNGQTSGYNVNWAAGNAQLFGIHSNNDFYQSGAGTPTGNLLNLTVNSTEFTTNPQFVAPGSSNFAIGNSSPAAGAGTPSNFPNIGASLTASFPDIGAAQRHVTAGGGAPPMIGAQ